MTRSLPLFLGCALAGCAATGALDGPNQRLERREGPGLTAAPTPIGPGMTVRALARDGVGEDVYLITDTDYFTSNILVVRMNDGSLVLCSSPFETEGARRMVAWLVATFAPPRIIAINTHFHFDGTGGNAAYAEAGVETWGSTHTVALLAERGEALRAGLSKDLADEGLRNRILALQITPPARTFDEKVGLTLDIAGEKVVVRHPGPSHAPDHVVVHFPSRGVLFGGCMVKTGSEIGYTGDADLTRWEDAIHVLETFQAPVVVPGHGAVGGPELLANTIRVVRAALGTATAP